MLEVRPRINKLRSLTVKGLLVIGLGTAVQLGCLTAYEVLLSRSDHLAAIEQRDKIVIGEINWLSTLVPVCGLLALDAGANNASSRQMRKECVQLIWQARDFLAPMISASNSLALVRVTNAVIDDCESLSCLVSSQPAITVRQVTDHSLLEKDYKVFAVLRHDIIIENHKKRRSRRSCCRTFAISSSRVSTLSLLQPSCRQCSVRHSFSRMSARSWQRSKRI